MGLVGIVDDLVACAADSVFCPRERVRERRSREGIGAGDVRNESPRGFAAPFLALSHRKNHQLRSSNDLRS